MDDLPKRTATDEMRSVLEEYLELFGQYAAFIFDRENRPSPEAFGDIQSRLRRMEPNVSRMVIEVPSGTPFILSGRSA